MHWFNNGSEKWSSLTIHRCFIPLNYGNASRLLFLEAFNMHYKFELTDLNIGSKFFAIIFWNRFQFGLSIQTKCVKMSV